MSHIFRALFLGLISLGWLPTNTECVAQKTFELTGSSTAYDVKVSIDKCDEEESRDNPSICSGPGKVSLYRKGSSAPFQVLDLKELEIDSEQTAYNSKINKSERKLYDDEYSVIFDDFNFDGSEDLAICNGRNGGYGAPSYNVYLYDKKSKRFAENVKLSRLTEGAYLGLFFIEPKKQQLTAFSKSGCCYHETEVYKVINNRPVLVEKTVEDATSAKTVVITTRKLVGGKWVKRVRREKIKPEDQ